MSIWKKFKDDTEKNTPSENAIYKAKQSVERESKEKAHKNLSRFGIATSIGCAVLAIIICIPTVFVPIIQSRKSNISDDTELPIKSAISIPVAANYDEIKEYLKNSANSKTEYYSDTKGSSNLDMAPAEAVGTAAATEGFSNTPDFSDTNNQVIGVSEADIIKTDGHYIYTVSPNGTVNITAVNNGTLTYMAHIPSTNENNTVIQASEIFIANNRLIIICNYYETNYNSEETKPSDSIIAYDYYYYYGYNNTKTIVKIYDTTDKSNPVLLDSLAQNGFYISSRMIGDKLYLITRENIPIVNNFEIEDYIPRTTDNAKETLLAPENIYICPEFEYRGFLIVSGIDTTSADYVSTVATVGSGYNVYASQNNIYVITSSYRQTNEGKHYTNFSLTLISRFSANDGTITLESSGEVQGYTLNQFSLDEYNNNLRIVTTIDVSEYDLRTSIDIPYGFYKYTDNYTNERHNAVFALDMGMNIVGSITDIAKDERVYSVRFAEEICYFVTFRQVDPLFAVDLSDPSKPVILSALKIPGFSEYMHPYGDGLLFGLGKDATEDGRVTGLKLSMFDISDPEDVSEISKYAMSNVQYSEASYNHKAILINAEKNIIAFQGNNKYYIFKYDKNSHQFVQMSEINLYGDNWNFGSMRGLYIGDFLYLFAQKGSQQNLISFDMNNNFSHYGQLILK